MQAKSESPTTNQSKSIMEGINDGQKKPQLLELFEEQLKDILWAEKALVKAIPRMISLATSEDLTLALADHLDETHEQITRLAKVFKSIDKKPATVKCDAMEGLIAEAKEMIEDCEKGPKCDAGIIAASQKIEHYEIATYGTLRVFAETLGLRDAEKLLAMTLNEEKAADKKLTEIALESVNEKAASAKA